MAFSFQSLLNNFSSKMSDTETKFINALTSTDYEAAKAHAYNLYEKSPNYLTLLCFCNLAELKSLLLVIAKKSSIDPCLIYLMTKSEEFNYKEIAEITSNYNSSNFIDLCIRKEVLIKKANELEINKVELNELIDLLDDYSLYDLAIKKGIYVNPRNSVNYKWYQVEMNNDLNSFISILTSSTDFDEISKLLKVFTKNKKYESIDDLELKGIPESYRLLVDYFLFGVSDNKIHKAFEILNNDASFLVLKLVLSMLISTNDDQNLILAFYLSSETYTTKQSSLNNTLNSNYEINLVHLFLNRYFMFHSNVGCILDKLAVKNIQLINTCYIWSDPMIVSCISLPDRINSFNNEIQTQIKTINNNIRQFIDKNRLAHAFSMINLKRRLENLVLTEEITTQKIKADLRTTIFSNLLGSQCSFLFDKLTVTDKRSVGGRISNLRSKKNDQGGNALFNNSFYPITDEKFISNFNFMNANKTKKV